MAAIAVLSSRIRGRVAWESGPSLMCCLTNERDFSVPSKPRAVRVAVYGNSVPRWRGESFGAPQLRCHQLAMRGEIMTIVTVGIDLAKNVFAVHGVDEAGKPIDIWKTCQAGATPWWAMP
jgi:hypothetical protein